MDFASAQTHAIWFHAHYPRAKYALDKEPVVVHNELEEDALGPDWFDHPSLTNNPGPRRWQDPSKPVVATERHTPGPSTYVFRDSQPVVDGKSTTAIKHLHESYRSNK